MEVAGASGPGPPPADTPSAEDKGKGVPQDGGKNEAGGVGRKPAAAQGAGSRGRGGLLHEEALSKSAFEYESLGYSRRKSASTVCSPLLYFWIRVLGQTSTTTFRHISLHFPSLCFVVVPC